MPSRLIDSCRIVDTAPAIRSSGTCSLRAVMLTCGSWNRLSTNGVPAVRNDIKRTAVIAGAKVPKNSGAF